MKSRGTARRIGQLTIPVCLVSALAAAIATACSGAKAVVAPERTLRIAARDTVEARDVLRSFLFAEGLFAVDSQGRPTPRLASALPEWEHGGYTLRVHLRTDVRFHDGTTVTASHVAEIIRQQISKSRTRGLEAVQTVEAPDEQTLLFHLRRLDGFLPGAIAGISVVDDRTPDIGTGPFRLVPNTTDLEAVRNTSYYRGLPGIERIQVIPYPTARASWVGLMSGKADMALEISESVEFLKGASRFEVYSSIQPFYIPWVFNIRNPILARVEVRQAIADAINRDEIVSQGMRDRGQKADDPIWPSYWAYNATGSQRNYNPNAARVRLDAAGLPMRPAAPGRRASRFQLKCAFFITDPQFERIALMLQRQLATVGIDLIVEGLPAEELIRRLGSGQFDSYLFQLTSGRDLGWTYRFWHSPENALGPVMQNTGYKGADAVLDRLRRARDDDDIRIGVGDLRQRFYEDVPAVFLAWMKTTRAVNVEFDIGDGAAPEIFANMYRWRLAATQTAAR